MNFLLHYILMQVIFALQLGIKNPQSLAKEEQLLTEVRDLINEWLAALHPGGASNIFRPPGVTE